MVRALSKIGFCARIVLQKATVSKRAAPPEKQQKSQQFRSAGPPMWRLYHLAVGKA
jgi:hypothetical protein